uniref:Uncharacterized protein n=1 Tax=Panagrolaimus sp. ES5 TaxID=591445 RepID=A0AC34FQR0_9BILA
MIGFLIVFGAASIAFPFKHGDDGMIQVDEKTGVPKSRQSRAKPNLLKAKIHLNEFQTTFYGFFNDVGNGVMHALDESHKKELVKYIENRSRNHFFEIKKEGIVKAEAEYALIVAEKDHHQSGHSLILQYGRFNSTCFNENGFCTIGEMNGHETKNKIKYLNYHNYTSFDDLLGESEGLSRDFLILIVEIDQEEHEGWNFDGIDRTKFFIHGELQRYLKDSTKAAAFVGNFGHDDNPWIKRIVKAEAEYALIVAEKDHHQSGHSLILQYGKFNSTCFNENGFCTIGEMNGHETKNKIKYMNYHNYTSFDDLLGESEGLSRDFLILIVEIDQEEHEGWNFDGIDRTKFFIHGELQRYLKDSTKAAAFVGNFGHEDNPWIKSIRKRLNIQPVEFNIDYQKSYSFCNNNEWLPKTVPSPNSQNQCNKNQRSIDSNCTKMSNGVIVAKEINSFCFPGINEIFHPFYSWFITATSSTLLAFNEPPSMLTKYLKTKPNNSFIELKHRCENQNDPTPAAAIHLNKTFMLIIEMKPAGNKNPKILTFVDFSAAKFNENGIFTFGIFDGKEKYNGAIVADLPYNKFMESQPIGISDFFCILMVKMNQNISLNALKNLTKSSNFMDNHLMDKIAVNTFDTVCLHKNISENVPFLKVIAAYSQLKIVEIDSFIFDKSINVVFDHLVYSKPTPAEDLFQMVSRNQKSIC